MGDIALKWSGQDMNQLFVSIYKVSINIFQVFLLSHLWIHVTFVYYTHWYEKDKNGFKRDWFKIFRFVIHLSNECDMHIWKSRSMREDININILAIHYITHNNHANLGDNIFLMYEICWSILFQKS